LVPDQVRITNFSLGDSILVTNAGANPASFTSRSSGKDIEFSMNVNGTLSTITLEGAVTTPGVLVYDEATAEKAAGFDFISFRFA
jgi:hypothetical protein